MESRICRRTFSIPWDGVKYIVAVMEQPISLLLIDDDLELCSLMQAFFAQHGINVRAAVNGAMGLESALSGRFDLIVLDIMLPEMGGMEVLHRIRARSTIPIIMLTARTEQQDRIEALEAGADDYLPKPFGPLELLARVRAVLRRSKLPAKMPDVIDIAGIRIDTNKHIVSRNGLKIELTSIEFAILEILMRSAGHVISRNHLAEAIYHREATPQQRAIDVHISNIRKKLGNGNQVHLVTVRGIGYLFRLKPTS